MQMKHTAGPWRIVQDEFLEVWTPKDERLGSRNNYAIATGIQNEDDARLIAEAGTVASETGLTPRQLAEQRRELLEACKELLAAYDGETECTEILEMIRTGAIRQAIAKAEGGAR